jgi:hypothetical protein
MIIGWYIDVEEVIASVINRNFQVCKLIAWGCRRIRGKVVHQLASVLIDVFFKIQSAIHPQLINVSRLEILSKRGD